MFKIRKVTFSKHPVLGNLSFDFCDLDGKAVDTIIIAGENGAGKSSAIESLYSLAERNAPYLGFDASVELEQDDNVVTLDYYTDIQSGDSFTKVRSSSEGIDTYIASNVVNDAYPLRAIYSDVDINFHSGQISSTTSMNLDENYQSRRSEPDLPTQINQLFIDIQAIDDAALATAARNNPNTIGRDLPAEQLMPRFTTAFSKMFDQLSYKGIVNKDGQKQILFVKNGVPIPIESLSSGEKQIVYRGAFLLKDAGVLDGAFVFIDEPEISLHPVWQSKILDYYKSMFIDSAGTQTSQLFIVTHSPFIVHNEARQNDKVIVLARNTQGQIEVKARPEYYKCESSEAVEDAFSTTGLLPTNAPTVFVEGITDEQYFNDALLIYSSNVPFVFKSVCYIDANGRERNGGSSALQHMLDSLRSMDMPTKNVDCILFSDT